MKLHTGLVLSGLLSLGVLSYACANGDTVSNSSGNSGGSTGSGTGGSSSGNSGGSNGNTGGSSSHTGGTNGSTGGTTGSTGGSSSHTGGTTGTGGVAATGGTTGTGTGGTTGTATGGTTGGTQACSLGGVKPAQALITDFSDAVADTMNAGQFKFGATAGDAGGTSEFASGTKGTLSVAGGALTFSATVEAPSTANMYPYNGFVLYLNAPSCADASTYSGVKFALSGVTGTCPLVFSFNDPEHTKSSDDTRGTCTGTQCYGSQYTVTSSTTMVSFSATASNPGQPTAAVDSAKILGVEFQFQNPTPATASCTGSLTIDNVSFF